MTYWEHSGRYQPLIEKIEHLIPQQGEAEDEDVELLRCVCNVYHDCYQNGGRNFDGRRGEELEKILSSSVVRELMGEGGLQNLRETLGAYREALLEGGGYEEVSCGACGGDGVDEDGETCLDCEGFGFNEEEIEGPGYLSDFCEAWELPLERLVDRVVLYVMNQQGK